MKNILVIVDAQNDFCHENGVLSNKQTCEAASNIVDMLENTVFDRIICTMDTHNEDYPNTIEGKHLPIVHCVENTWGWKIREDIYKSLYYQDNVEYLHKSKFAPVSLELWEKVGIIDDSDKVYVCGLCTDICVISTAFQLKNLLNCEVCLLENCCAGSNPEKHYSALRVMESCQINIINGEYPNDIKMVNVTNPL